VRRGGTKGEGGTGDENTTISRIAITALAPIPNVSSKFRVGAPRSRDTEENKREKQKETNTAKEREREREKVASSLLCGCVFSASRN
jgi:hypothetical protein